MSGKRRRGIGRVVEAMHEIIFRAEEDIATRGIEATGDERAIVFMLERDVRLRWISFLAVVGDHIVPPRLCCFRVARVLLRVPANQYHAAARSAASGTKYALRGSNEPS